MRIWTFELMIVVIPMAGNSQRFKDAGYVEPKFKLTLADRSIFSHVIRSFENYFSKFSFLFIHRDEGGIEKFIISECKVQALEKPILVGLSKPTHGQADTVLQGLNAAQISESEAITIFNIDTFRPNFYFPTNLDLNKIDGYLEVFRGSGKNWSYVRSHPSGNNQVAETAEKVQISNLCCTGLYYFRETSSFRKAYAVETSNHNLREYYVAPLYNHLIAEGAQIFYHEIFPSEVTFCGIPEEYEALKIQQEIRNGG